MDYLTCVERIYQYLMQCLWRNFKSVGLLECLSDKFAYVVEVTECFPTLSLLAIT